jgi:hypothetical protein
MVFQGALLSVFAWRILGINSLPQISSKGWRQFMARMRG